LRVTNRRFANFGLDVPYFGMREVPQGDLCLSVFLVLSKDNNQNEVLMGKVNREYDNWPEIGAINEERAQRYSSGWILPSRHLILLESPQEAAKTVLKEQLGLDHVELSGPKLITEVYDIERLGLKDHWDFDFVFRGAISEAPRHPAWTELKFVDVSSSPDAEFARNHQDILVYTGLRPSKR
jgi:hypothetical protein